MKNRRIIWILAALGTLLLQQIPAWGQVAREVKWLRTGSLRHYISNIGAEVEIGRTGRETEQVDGLAWPAQFRYQDNLVGKAMWIGTTNYNDPYLGKTIAHKVVSVGPKYQHVDLESEMMPVEFRMIGRFAAPTVVVDGVRATDNDLNDVIDEIDPELLPDRMVINKLNTSIGLTVTRKAMQFAQENHDNYIVYDYIVKNTGIVDLKGTRVDKTLTDVILYFLYRYSAGWEAFKLNWAPINNISWGRNIMNQVVGTNPAAAGFEFRGAYSWYGLHSQSIDPLNSWGCPNWTDGRLGAVQYMGSVILHADTAPANPADDPSQPRTTRYIGSDTAPIALDQYNTALMTAKYAAMSAGHAGKTHADEVGSGFADIWGTDGGGYSQSQGFGPYTLAPGDSIHIVLAEGVAGLQRDKTMEVGANWFSDAKPFTLPGGGTTDDKNVYKNSWVQTGKDSILQTFRRALANYGKAYRIPQPPPPPSVFEVNSGGDRIQLSWSGTAESWPNFDGYEIWRAVGRPDTTYERIFSCTRDNAVNQYDDTKAARGLQYYYYLVSKDDGSTNDIHPGVPLRSSRFYTMTNQPAYLRRPAGETLDDVKDAAGNIVKAGIRVVPNPFHIRARDIQFGKEAPDQIAFYNLPPVCTIKIYNENGDLIDTIEHDDGSGDELWYSTTEFNQIIVSGIYIAYFVTPEGASTYRKFIVIR